jgi:ribosomal protein L14E/L6E/L27E
VSNDLERVPVNYEKNAPMGPGRLVISLKGRDKERVFMVTGIIDENYVTIADGSLRKLENAKKKKIKHLAPFGAASDRITEKLRDGKKITNAELRKMIKGLDGAPAANGVESPDKI